MTIAVFRAYVAPEHHVENDRLYAEMHALVQQSRGYVEHKLFTAHDGETALVVEFDDLDSLEEWGDHPGHELAQETGRSHVFLSYDVAVCEVVERHIKTTQGE